MMTEETIPTRSNLPLRVEKRESENQIEVILKSAFHEQCLLHWGVRRSRDKEWQIPPPTCWPADSRPFGKGALQSPFQRQNGDAKLAIKLDQSADYAWLEFALFFPEANRWDNNGGRNYKIPLHKSDLPAVAPQDALRAQAGDKEITFDRAFPIDDQSQLAVMVTKIDDCYRVSLLSNIPESLILHWGVAQRLPREWLAPSKSMCSTDTIITSEKSAETPFVKRDGYNSLKLEFAQADAPLGIQFVLREPDSGRWLKNRSANFYVPINVPPASATAPGRLKFQKLADEIVEAETTHNSWTLMHRFNLCHDMLDGVGNDLDGLALLYVWLRYSAIRQLTWQRNYNTKPRELAHSQDRITHKLAEIYRANPAARPLVRLMLVTVGRGGEGQRIRDEILNIMHRHHIKEVSGHFLEEWHQKLHNNTTPDDIVICEAYLEFLKSDGNQEKFVSTLEAGGVSRKRLENFERPIKSDPDFVPHLKDGLIHDFYHFLGILKASHSSTDFETAINSTRNQLDGQLQGVLNHIWHHRNDPNLPLVELVKLITEVRLHLPGVIESGHNMRELLYLDLALEQLLRGAVERNIHLRLSGDQLAEIILLVLENVKLSYPDTELDMCLRHWNRLQTLPRFSEEWSLRATSVIERIARATSGWIDRLYQLLQPKAEYLGRGFQAETWTISLFSEEVVRGGSLGFVLSMLLHHLNPLLRQTARLGDWQIISRGQGAGTLVVADSLHSLQRTRFDAPTVVVADKVRGDEEIPEGVTAVIAPDVTDIVSHVAVRARNANILFASCHDTATLEQLKSMRGKFLQLDVKSDGDILVKEHEARTVTKPATAKAAPVRPKLLKKLPENYAIALTEFDEKSVGGKSCNIARLRQQLPEWIHVPGSAALPFGVFDRVLNLDLNKDIAKRYSELTRQLEKDDPKTLTDLQETVMALKSPKELQAALREAMSVSGLSWPGDWDKAWTRIRQVWASKWNERAYLSRKRVGIPHDSLFMAVLVQEVVPADYAFVVHTVNPTNGNPDELYAELVLGLGETLVGNHPGRAFRVTCNKKSGNQTILAYPSKSTGLFGSGLIFRSDSNGEDLAGYAGAGLYDSLLLEPPTEKTLDYSQEPLVWDENFRLKLMDGILRIGIEIERSSGSPQDIEGAVVQGKYYVVQTRPQVGLEASK